MSFVPNPRPRCSRVAAPALPLFLLCAVWGAAEERVGARDEIEAQVLEELAALRRDPPAYARKLERRLARHQGRYYVVPGEPRLVTVEGASAVREAMEALERTPPLRELAPDPTLARAARAHVEDMGRSGVLGHRGSDGSLARDRVARQGVRPRKVAEVINHGPDDAETIVVELLVDDGIPDRGHRLSLLDRELRAAGVARGPHAAEGAVAVIVLASF